MVLLGLLWYGLSSPVSLYIIAGNSVTSLSLFANLGTILGDIRSRAQIANYTCMSYKSMRD